MKERRKRKIKSAVAICRLLSTEGFTDHTANEVERYWRESSGLTGRQKRQIEKLERELTELCFPMSVGQRMVLGRFIGLHKKMSFETGLRIGLGVSAVRLQRDEDVTNA